MKCKTFEMFYRASLNLRKKLVKYRFILVVIE